DVEDPESGAVVPDPLTVDSADLEVRQVMADVLSGRLFMTSGMRFVHSSALARRLPCFSPAAAAAADQQSPENHQLRADEPAEYRQHGYRPHHREDHPEQQCRQK